jgi:hypothetical protein
MIVSHKHKFIFIKTTKTAGTSVEIALSKFCGPDDIITPISPEDEEKRQALGFPGPQHYLAPFSDYQLSDYRRFLFRGKRKKQFYNHMPASEIMQCIEPDIWNRYYKFCFERNPWDRFISSYYWRCKSGFRPAVKEFIAAGALPRLRRGGAGLYRVDDQVVVDDVYRFENLAEELQIICARLGISGQIELPRTKAKTRKDKRSYRDILDAEESNCIAESLSDVVELMDYKF